MARKRERAFALFAALLFLTSSLGVSGLVIYEIIQQQKADKESVSDVKTETKNSSKGKQLANFTPVTDVRDLKIEDTKVGTGEAVQEGNTVIAHYTGALAANGVIFESSLDSGQPFSAPLKQGSLIEGWVKGIPGMKAGGKRRLIIPAKLAYGEQGSGEIPPNAPLVFDIELISFDK